MDNIVTGDKGILDLWKLMNISNDRFIRTTDDYHVKSIQKIFKKMHDKGDIYKGKYVGKYCKPCESFWTESQLVDGKCPDCGREVQDAEEEAYFFRLSKYAKPVQDLLENTDFLEPRSRVNEMVNNFIKPGLEDLCVSRTSFTWGIPVDFDPGHVVYVWVDALFNYTTALGFMNDKYDDYDKFWPADVHFVGKEIVRFHSIIWPAMLMSMGMPLPKKVYGHGWLLLDGGKMSKSKGNVVDPYLLAERFGTDALRFFLLRTFPFGSDGNFSNEALINTINVDLANDLGNLVSRTTAMVGKYFGGKLPEARQADALDDDLLAQAKGLRDRYGRHGALRLPGRAGRGVQGRGPRQQVYRRDRPLGAGQGHGCQRRPAGHGHVQPAGDHPHLRRAADPLHAREHDQAVCPDRRGRGRPDLGERRRMGRPVRRPPASPRARTSSPAWTPSRPSPSWRPPPRPPRRPPSPPWRWSPRPRRRWTLTPSASPTSAWSRSRTASR